MNHIQLNIYSVLSKQEFLFIRGMENMKMCKIKWSQMSLIIFLCVIVALSQNSKRKCTIKNLIGDVKVQRAKSPKWIKARPNMPLKENDAIRTFVESEATLQTSEGSVITLTENTTLQLSSFSQQGNDTKTGLKILSGNLMANVKKLVSVKSKFEFETPTAVAAIRGTIVGFEVEKSTSKIKVYEGKVYVAPKGSKKGAELKSNQMTTVKKGQKKVVIEKLVVNKLEKERSSIPSAMDSVIAKDTSENLDTIPVDTVGLKKDTVEIDNSSNDTLSQEQSSTKDTRVELIVLSPKNGQQITSPMIKVTGKASIGADVTISGMGVSVSSSGSFSKEIPIPDEPGEFSLEIEANLGGKTKVITIQINYQPVDENIVIAIHSPAKGLVFCEDNVTVKGNVRPSVIDELLINGTKARVLTSGNFSEVIKLSDVGENEIEVEAQKGDVNKIIRTTVVYDPVSKVCNVDVPYIQPSTFPLSINTKVFNFTVLDRTITDEITVYGFIDGRKELEETGATGSSYSFELEEGLHKYELYAQDVAGNKSTKVVGEISLLLKDLYIRLLNPSSNYFLIHIPPSNPDGDFEPEFTIEISIENLPDDDPKLLKQIIIKNTRNGDGVVINRFTNDIEFEADLALEKGKNRIAISVQDMRDRIYNRECLIEVK